MFVTRQIHHLKTVICLILVSFFMWSGIQQAKAADPVSFAFNNFHTGSAKMAGIPFSITITALDQNGDVINDYTNTATLSDETGTLYPTETGNFTNGVWTGIVYISGAKVNNIITASFNSASSSSAAFTVNADPRMAYLSISGGNYQTNTVGNQLSTALAAKVIDPYGNPLPNLGVNFAITTVPTSATGQTISSNSAISDVDGSVSVSFKLGSKIGTYVVSASLATGVDRTILFNATATPSTLLSLAITPMITVVPAGSYLPFKATGYDKYFNEIASPQVTWSVQNGGGTIDPAGVFYAGYVLGNFSNTIKATSTTIGTTASVSIVDTYKGTVTPQSGASNGSSYGVGIASIAAVPTPVPGALNTIQIEPSVLSILENARIPILAQGVDFFGNPVSGVSYQFQSNGNLGSITQTGPNSALLTGSGSGTGTVSITATQGGITKTVSIAGSVGNGIDRRLVIEDIASPQQVGEPFTISIAAKDSQNNFVTDYKGPLVIADTTGTIDPAVVQPSQTGIWYVQAIINVSNPEVSVTVAGDGMVGVSNIFEVVGDPKKSDLGIGKGAGFGGMGDVLGASISGKIKELLAQQDVNKYSVIKYIGAGLAAGFGILGASIGGGIMVSRGLEAIGRNPFAKSRLQINLYASLVAFIIAASLAVFVSTIIMK